MASPCNYSKGNSDFSTTQWSVVLEAQQSCPSRANHALERLCIRYWQPLYAFVRRRGHAPHDAEDLTQSFFAHLLGKNGLRRVDPEKGRFRAFLLASLINFLNDERDRQRAAKRGGCRQIVPLDAARAEDWYCREPLDSFTPEKLFEHRWALTLIEQVLVRLRREYEVEGNGRLFDQLEPFLTGEISTGCYAKCASDLAMTEGAVRVALHRMRRRLGDLLRNEIAHTVSRPEEIAGEIRHLIVAFSRLG